MGACICKIKVNEDAQVQLDNQELNNEIQEGLAMEQKQLLKSEQFIKSTSASKEPLVSKEWEKREEVSSEKFQKLSQRFGASMKLTPEMLVRKYNIHEKFMAHYEIIKQLGQGGFGVVYLVRHIQTQILRAAKVVNRITINNEGQLLEETEILKQLDHPNIVKILEVFADFKFYYIITEFCAGGDLLERVRSLTSYNEKLSSTYMKQILSAIFYCHKHNIVHRDLKPENILFDSKSPDANLKVIDFGASEKMVDHKHLTKKIGTPYYVAPEVITSPSGYDEKVDVWSCGVIMYILLVGRPPFRGNNDYETIKLARSGYVDFSSEKWSRISQEAKEMIGSMLVVDPTKRISIEEAYNHLWIQKSISQGPELQLVGQLSQFSAQNKLKLAIFQFLSVQIIQKEEQEKWLNTFKQLDANGDGVLSDEELVKGLIASGEDECKAKMMVKEIVSEMDANDSGKVDFTEFISAAIMMQQKISLENIRSAFRLFDLDGNGQISKEELEQVFGGIEIDNSAWKDILDCCDHNKDGLIQQEEFVVYLQKINV